MAPAAVERWKYAQQVENRLKGLLTDKNKLPSYNEIEGLLQEFRIACEATIFLDFQYAHDTEVEERLWQAHVSINKRYRMMLDAFRKPEKSQHLVEKRNVEKHYVDFIKTSQYFYKGYIQRLASHFSAMQSLRRIAHRLSLQTLTADARVRVTPELEEMIEASCHESLLRLGDLSRYRNQVRVKDRSWEPAMGYYALANDLCPDKGGAHNQMATIALSEGDHLGAVYHLLRAIIIKEDHPCARANLGTEFKKIVRKQRRSQDKTDSLQTLIGWFVLLQARFHEGQEFSTRQELEKEVLSRLALLLRDQSFGDDFEKIVIVSIAAHALAAERVHEEVANLNGAETEKILSERADPGKSYAFCLELNVRMMLVLLQVLSPELDHDLSGEELPQGTLGSRNDKPREKITAVARRVLPALRQYNTWLASQVHILTGDINPALKMHVSEMWNMYAIVLTKLINFYPVADLPVLPYLLEEDEATLGFEPFRNPNLFPNLFPECDLFTDIAGVPKVHSTDLGVERSHPNIEMQARIRDIIVTAAKLESVGKIPLTVKVTDGRHIFIFIDDNNVPLASPRILASPQRSEEPASSFGLTPLSPSFMPEQRSRNKHAVHQQESITASDGMDSDLHMSRSLSSMVDDLLEPPVSSPSNDTSYGMHSNTANEVFAPYGIEPRFQGTPKMLPSLTGLYNSAFAPQAHELQATSPNRPSTARQLSPLSLSTKENRLAAAAALEQMTGYSSLKTSSGSWGRSSARPLSGSMQQPAVNQILQESLSQQFLPYSSNFPESSSIYGNTPEVRNRFSGGATNGNGLPTGNGNSTIYAGASDFDRTTMLQSSIWNGSQSAWNHYAQTPPGGQGG